MGARILFYVLQQNSEREAMLFACHLIEKMVKKSLRVSVITSNETELKAFDNALWTFKPNSFIAHTTQHDTSNVVSQVILHQKEDTPAPLDVWLSLVDTEALGLLSFSHIVHIIRNDDAIKAKARSQFKYYRELNFIPETITI